MTSHPLCARLRVGAETIAVPAGAVLRALVHAEAPVSVPRRAGAIVGACASPWGVIPVVDLSLWLPIRACTAPARTVLVLRVGRKRVGVRVDAMGGVQPVRTLSRLHHDTCPEELFQSVAQWQDGTVGPVLEVDRLMALTQVWCDEAGFVTGDGRGAEAGSSESRRGTAHAIVKAGGSRWAIATSDLLAVVPAPPLEFATLPGAWLRGICTWQGRKLPVLDLARREGVGTTTGPLMAVVAHGPLAMAVLVDSVVRVADLPVLEGGDPSAVTRTRLGHDDVWRIDVVQLLVAVPEASLSRPSGPAPRSVTASARTTGSAYILFEADTTYATPFGQVLQVLPLDLSVARRAGAGMPCTVPFEDMRVPLVCLPSFSGRPSPLATVALVVRAADGSIAAVAVARLRGWADGAEVQAGAMRTASLGDLRMVTVQKNGHRSSHTVVDLAEAAQVLA